jgi:hypothetical protein
MPVLLIRLPAFLLFLFDGAIFEVYDEYHMLRFAPRPKIKNIMKVAQNSSRCKYVRLNHLHRGNL